MSGAKGDSILNETLNSKWAHTMPLIIHIVFRLDVGGLENGLVNLLNNMPKDYYRNAVICMEEATEFQYRIRDGGIPVYALHKKKGKDFGAYLRLWKLIKKLRPDIVHTRNLGTLDALVPAALAGVKYRIHGEHGWNVTDSYGASWKYQLLRRACHPFVTMYVPLSKEIEQWLHNDVGIACNKLFRIRNGVDAELFHPSNGDRVPLPINEFAPDDSYVIGTVGRLETVKDQLTLVRAFLHLRDISKCEQRKLRLVIIGDGSLKPELEGLLRKENAEDVTWMPGARNDVAQLLHGLDVFVLPSLREGISNTILEAMASGLPVIATNTGGNPELIIDGSTGFLVPPTDHLMMADALKKYLKEPKLAKQHGRAARNRIEKEFSLDVMVDKYLQLYKTVLSGRVIKILSGDDLYE
jgi:sugar transferase (PEP-CTERM/EpsH1 system associated)